MPTEFAVAERADRAAPIPTHPLMCVDADSRRAPDTDAWRDSHRNCFSAFFNKKLYLGTLCCGANLIPLSDVKIFVHIMFVVFAVASAALGAASALIQGSSTNEWGDAALWLIIFVAVAPMCFATQLVHELAHCVAAKFFTGLKPRGRAYAVLIAPTGGVADVQHAGGAWRELVVAIAGPLTQLVQTVLWFLVLCALTFWADVPNGFCTGGAKNGKNPCASMAIAPLFGAEAASYAFSSSGSLVAPTLPPWMECVRLAKVNNLACGGSSFFFNVARYGVLINACYFAANVFVPHHPLDGGRAAVAFLMMCQLPMRFAALALMVYGAFVGFAGILLAIWLVFFVWPLVGFIVGWFAIYSILAFWEIFKAIRNHDYPDLPLFEVGVFYILPLTCIMTY